MADTDRLLRLAEQADSLDGPTTEKLLTIAASTSNDHLREQIRKALGVKAARFQHHPFHAPTDAGHLKLGVEPESGGNVSVSASDLNRHMLVVGQTGSGKTTFFYNLIDQLDVPWWAFDLKQDYRHLANDINDLLVLPWQHLRFNPLQPPPGVRPRRWVQVFADVFGHSTGLLSGSKNYMMRIIIELYHLYNVQDDDIDTYPSLLDLRDYISEDNINYARTTANYRDRLLNRLGAMTLTAGSVFDCSRGYPFHELLQRPVVFEFDGLGRDTQNLLMEVLFAFVFEYRLSNSHRNEDLRHVFLLDEGKRVFSVYKERQDAAGIPEIDALTAQMREFGEGLVVADQEPTKLTESIKANTYLTVLMGMGDHNQFSDVASSIGLSSRQREVARHIDVGEAIIQIGNGNPAPAALDDYSIRKDVTDDELRHLQEPVWRKLSYIPRRNLDTLSSTGEKTETGAQQPGAGDYSGQVGRVDVSDEAAHLLRGVLDEPFKSLTERYDIFSTNRKGMEAKNELLDAGLVREKQVKESFGRMKLLALTEEGREYLEDEGFDTEHVGRGGVVHRYWQQKIRDLFQDEGWSAGIEEHDADVLAEKDGRSVAVEVAMRDREREADHVADRLDQGVDEVIVGCRSEVVMDGIQNRLEKRGLLSSNVHLMLLRDVADARVM